MKVETRKARQIGQLDQGQLFGQMTLDMELNLNHTVGENILKAVLYRIHPTILARNIG